MTTKRSANRVGLALLLCSPGTWPDVLHDHDNGPLTGIFGIPDSTEGAHFAAAGHFALDTVLLTSSHSVRDVADQEMLLLDGETTRLDIRYRVGLGGNAEIGVEIPYLWHESGGLDHLVASWHDWFGFPGGFRSTRPSDELEFRYDDPGGTRLDYSQNANGLGDVRLFGGLGIRSAPGHRLALRLGVKLPTGDAADLLGSGGVDVSVGLAGDLAKPWEIDGLTAFYRLSGVLVGKPDILADRHRRFAAHLSFGAGYETAEWLELRLQGALRSALYDSDVEILGETYGAVSFGANFRLSRSLTASFAIAEDIKVRSAPDVSFQIGLRYVPR